MSTALSTEALLSRPIVPADRSLLVLRICAWAATLAIGLLESWSERFWLSPDGTNYLDIASAYLRHDWQTAINAYWSPMFSWLLAVVFAVFKPSPYNDSTGLRLLNFAALLVTLACFEFLLRGLLTLQSRASALALPVFHYWLLGYALFLSTSIFVLEMPSTPDVWVAALTYLVAGIVLRVELSGGKTLLFAALGIALGIAYLTKAFYLPLSGVFFATAWLATGAPRANLQRLAVGLVLFSVIAGTWIGVLSRSERRFTYGDVGKIALAMTNDRIPQQIFWRGENNTGVPLHAVRQLLENPVIFDYSSHARATYPPMFDRSYWMAGVRPYFYFKGVLLAVRQSIGSFFVYFMAQAEFLAALLMLLLAGSTNVARRSFWSLRHLWAPAAIACCAYTPVLVEGRYVASFLLVLWLAGFFALISRTEVSPRVLRALVLGVALVCGLRVAKRAELDLLSIASRAVNADWEVAEAIKGLGAEPGDAVAGMGIGGDAHWARVAQLRLVSEAPPGENVAFFSADETTQQRALLALAGTGAKFVVTDSAWPWIEKQGWTRLGRTTFYAHALPGAIR
jgi:hypothetical protein